MSLSRMVSLGGARTLERTVPMAEAAAGGDAARTQLESAMDKIVAFIPSEVIGIYVAGMGIISPTTAQAKWVIFGVCCGLIPVFMLLAHLLRRKKNLPFPEPRIFVLLVVIALICFTAWSAAMPATPFLEIYAGATQVGGWAVVILAALLYQVADLLDLVPKSN